MILKSSFLYKPHRLTLVFNPIRVNLTIKRFYPGSTPKNISQIPNLINKPILPNMNLIPYKVPAVIVFPKPHLAQTSLISMQSFRESRRLADKYKFEHTQNYDRIDVNIAGVATIFSKSVVLSTPEINDQLDSTKSSQDSSVSKQDEHKEALAVAEPFLQQLDAKPVVETTFPDITCSKASLTYMSNSGKLFVTYITETTTSENITDNDLILELTKRELIKLDEGNTAVVIKLNDDSDFLLGTTKHGIKLSPLGQAYSSQIMKSQEIQLYEMTKEAKKSDEFIIIVPPKSNDDLLLETGQQKHLIVVHNNETNEYYAIGYLTSKKSAELLCDQQFVVFQKKQEQLAVTEKEIKKTQGIVKFNIALKINSEDINRVKNDKLFLANLSDTSKQLLLGYWQNLYKLNFYQEFNRNGLTKDHCLQMCKEHDKIIINKSKHPLTLDQIKQNEDNTIKQQKDNLNKPVKSNEILINND